MCRDQIQPAASRGFTAYAVGLVAVSWGLASATPGLEQRSHGEFQEHGAGIVAARRGGDAARPFVLLYLALVFGEAFDLHRLASAEAHDGAHDQLSTRPLHNLQLGTRAT